MIGPAIKAKLQSSTAIADLVGLRIYAQKKNLPAYTEEGEATRPYITYSVLSGDAANTVNGTGTTGVQRARVQIRAWADTYTEVDQLQDLIKTLLNGKAWTAAGVRVLGTFLTDFGDDYTPPIDADEVGAQESSSDFSAVFTS